MNENKGIEREPNSIIVFEHNYIDKSRKIVKLEDVIIRNIGEKLYWIDVWGKENLEALESLGIDKKAIESLTENIEFNVKMYPDDMFRFDLGHLCFEDWIQNWDFTVQNMHCLLGGRFLISYHERDSELSSELINHYVSDQSVTSKHAVFLIFEMFHHMIDSLLRVHNTMQNKLVLLDKSVVTRNDDLMIEASKMQNDFLIMREIDHYARNVLNHLSNRSSLFVSQNTLPAVDNMSMVLERLEDDLVADREICSNILNIYMTIVNFRMNLIIKKITSLNLIFSGVALLAAIYIALPKQTLSAVFFVIIMVICGLWISKKF
ncbi:MAG TPA: hypothetical protein ENI61_03485 [Ignavibacteria bacterium]|nr:hypothetical protein [Ignavibacteria bacterium]